MQVSDIRYSVLHHIRSAFTDLSLFVVLARSYCITALISPYILPIAAIIPYANSLDPDETQSNSASHPDPSCLTLGQYFHQL